MKNYLLYIPILLCVVFFGSCEKVVDLDLGNESGKLVIEGNLSNSRGKQIVKLSTNVPFSDVNKYPAVVGAQVSISDQKGINYNLVEGPLGTYAINNVAGIPGNTYTLSVWVNGKTYQATSAMPEVVRLDSITAKINEFDKKNKQDITVHYTDPKGRANQYRFVMFVNDVQVRDVMVADDDLTDGRRIAQRLRQQDIDIYAGDRVRVEMQCIDKPIYTYWSVLMSQSGSGAGGGITPANPPTNINPTALGYFSAYTTSSKTLIVK